MTRVSDSVRVAIRSFLGAAGFVGTTALLVAVLVAVIVAACAGPSETPPAAAFTPPPASSAGSGLTASQDLPESPIAGIVTSVDATGLTAVKGFTLRTAQGQDLTFVIGTLDNEKDFPPGHLTEHLAAAAPILVFFKVVDDKLVVYHLEDAG